MAEKEQIRTQIALITGIDRSFSTSFVFPENQSEFGGYYNDSDPIYIRLTINNYDADDIVYLSLTNSGNDVTDEPLTISEYGGQIDLYFSKKDYKSGDTISLSGHFEESDSWCSAYSTYVMYRAEREDATKVYLKYNDDFLYTTDVQEVVVASNTIGKYWISVEDFELIMRENYHNITYQYPGARNSMIDVYLENGHFSNFYNLKVKYYQLVKKDKIYLRQTQ